MEEKSFEENN